MTIDARASIQAIRQTCARFARHYHNGAVGDHVLTSVVFIGSSAFAFLPLVILFVAMQPKVLTNRGTGVPVVPRVVFAEPPPADLEQVEATLPSIAAPRLAQANAGLQPEANARRATREKPRQWK